MNAGVIGGFLTLYRRRLAVALKTPDRIVGTMLPPVLWVLIIAPALGDTVGEFRPELDYFTFVAVAQVSILIPFTSMFSGINVIVDRESGVLRELLAAPVPRSAIPLANAAAVLTIAIAQTGIIAGLGLARGADFEFPVDGVLWFLAAAALLSLATYGMAEALALAVGRQEAYGPLIPAVGVTPWFISGALFSLATLPAAVEAIALLLPWTHALAVMRFGIQPGDPGLADIWGMSSNTVMATLSLAVLALYSLLTLAVANRLFFRKTIA
jgi:ABC-2 type transport system permease protein